MDWNKSSEDLDFCATCYGASRTYFLRDEKQLFDKNGFLRTLFGSRCTQELEGVTVQKYDLQGAPLIKKYKSVCPEGFIVIHVENKDSAMFKEKVNFTKFSGLELLKP